MALQTDARRLGTVLAFAVVVAVACGGGGSSTNDKAQLYCVEGNPGACGCGYRTSPSAGDPNAACPPTATTPGWFWYCASTEQWPASGASCNCGAYTC